MPFVWFKNLPWRTYVLVGLLLVALQALVLHAFGQPLFCQCGYVSLWAGKVLSGENSQQLFDWYTFSHIGHGFIFYFLLSLLAPRLSIGARLLLAVGVEMSWEILENTPMVINHYRQQALAQGYTGDSILNSVSDTFSMIFGFILSRKLPVWLIILLAIGMESFTIYMVRDGLLFNIINLIHPLPALEHWQVSGLQ